jgi:hypothetical protein
MNVSKVSEITTSDLAEYIRLTDPSQDDLNTLGSLLTVAKCYCAEYMGRTIQELDDYRDIVIAVMILVQDMWDNRTLYVDSSNANKVVESILNLHSVNLL